MTHSGIRLVGIRALMVVALLMVAAGGAFSVAYAGSAFSNAKGVFAPPAASPFQGADGEVIVNYVKGRSAWNVQGNATSLATGADVYFVHVGTLGITGSTVVATFSTNGDGDGRLRENHVPDLPDDYNVIRIRPTDNNGGADTPAALDADDHLVAGEDADVPGSLEFRGQGRGR